MYFYQDNGVEGIAFRKFVSEYSHSFSDIVNFYVAERVDINYYKQKRW